MLSLFCLLQSEASLLRFSVPPDYYNTLLLTHFFHLQQYS